MMFFKNKIRAKKADGIVELIFATALTVIILFTVINLFASNIQTIAGKGGILRVFGLSSEPDPRKTVYESWGVDPTKTQVNVQVVGEHGLSWYINSAQKTIDKYKENPPQKEEITDKQKEELARAALVRKIANEYGLENVNDQNLDAEFISQYGISIHKYGESYNVALNNQSYGTTINFELDSTPLMMIKAALREPLN